MSSRSEKRGKRGGISWEKKERSSPVKESLTFKKTLIFKRLYEEKVGIPTLQAELAESGLSVSGNTLRAFVYDTFEEEFGRPVSAKKKLSPEMQQLADVKDDLIVALYETDVSYSDIRRCLDKEKITVTLVTLIKYIRSEIYSLRPPPGRFKKMEDKRSQIS